MGTVHAAQPNKGKGGSFFKDPFFSKKIERSTSILLTYKSPFALLFVMSIFMMLPSSIFAKNCDKDVIGTSKGSIITTTSHHIYKIDIKDLGESELWKVGANLLICPRTIKMQNKSYHYFNLINIEEEGEVSAQRIQ